MDISIKLKGAPRVPLRLPYDSASYVEADEDEACPLCGVAPLRARGCDRAMEKQHDRIVTDAYCVDCRKPIGRMTVTFSTIFGIEEDERVLSGRWRVY